MSGRHAQADRTILALLRAEVRVSGALERALAPAGFTLGTFNVLMELASSPRGRLPLHRLARQLVRSAPNITALVDRLEAGGLVRRARDTPDRRVVIAEITDRGWQSLGGIARSVFAAEQVLLGALSLDDMAALRRLLEAIP